MDLSINNKKKAAYDSFSSWKSFWTFNVLSNLVNFELRYYKFRNIFKISVFFVSLIREKYFSKEQWIDIVSVTGLIVIHDSLSKHIQKLPKSWISCVIFLEIILLVVFFLENNLTGEAYLNLLKKITKLAIMEIGENYVNYSKENLLSQRIGAPPLYFTIVRQCLDHHFLNKWIGRRGVAT